MMKHNNFNNPMHRGNNSIPEVFMVALEATSYKEIPIRACSENEALELARDMYFNTDTIEFTDEDVEAVSASVIDDDTEDTDGGIADRKLEAMTQLVHTIRAIDLPDAEVADMLVDFMDKQLTKED